MANEAEYGACRRCLRGELRIQRSQGRWLITAMNLWPFIAAFGRSRLFARLARD
jgi:hypothetical protein